MSINLHPGFSLNPLDHLGLVHKILRQHCMHLIQYSSYDDLFQEGYLGLVKGLENLDLSQKCKPSAYLGKWIFRYAYSYSISQSGAVRDKQYTRTQKSVVKMQSLNVPVKNEKIGGGRFDCSNNMEKIDLVTSELPTPDIEAEVKERLRFVREALKRFKDRERRVIQAFFFDGMTLAETGKNLKPPLSRERIRQIMETAIAKLKKECKKI
jgi:RNA polymerase sigma factor (sigma-70 family)